MGDDLLRRCREAENEWAAGTLYRYEGRDRFLADLFAEHADPQDRVAVTIPADGPVRPADATEPREAPMHHPEPRTR